LTMGRPDDEKLGEIRAFCVLVALAKSLAGGFLRNGGVLSSENKGCIRSKMGVKKNTQVSK